VLTQPYQNLRQQASQIGRQNEKKKIKRKCIVGARLVYLHLQFCIPFDLFENCLAIAVTSLCAAARCAVLV
jgi:hypothetical protein